MKVKPPKLIKLLGQRIPVDYSNEHIIRETDASKGEDQNLLGLWEGDESVIRIAKHQGEENMRETLLHEVLHAVNTQMGVKRMFNDCKAGGGTCDHEFATEQIAIGIMAVLRDNPKFVAYLLDPSPVVWE